MHQAKKEGKILDLKIIDHCTITHLHFVDDVIIFRNGGIQDSTTFHGIMVLFSATIVMEPNNMKSTITFFSCSIQEMQTTSQKFPYH